MNATEEKVLAFDDLDIDVPTGGDFETIPAGMYNARLVGFTVTDKPDWKLTGEEGEDKQQWEWTFELVDGDYQGTRLKNYTNRSWHEKANAHKHAAALLGVPTLPVGVGMSTRQLAGKPCQVWVIEKGTKKDPNDLRNYVDKVTPMPTPRMRPIRPQSAPQPQGPLVHLPGYPGDEDEEDIAF